MFASGPLHFHHGFQLVLLWDSSSRSLGSFSFVRLSCPILIVFILSCQFILLYLKMNELINNWMKENLVIRVKANSWIVIYTCWDTENQFSPMEWHCAYQTTPGQISCSGGVDQHTMDSTVLFCFSSCACAFICLQFGVFFFGFISWFLGFLFFSFFEKKLKFGRVRMGRGSGRNWRMGRKTKICLNLKIALNNKKNVWQKWNKIGC